MDAVTSIPFVKRTRAILRSAEFGFLGVIVRTIVHTPRFCGEPSPRISRFRLVLSVNRSAGALVFFDCCLRPLRINWLIVGTALPPPRASAPGYKLISLFLTKRRPSARERSQISGDDLRGKGVNHPSAH